MSRRYGDHCWVRHAGPRGSRSVRADRCSRCGFNRAKRNGFRVYWRVPDIDYTVDAPACVPPIGGTAP